MMASYSLNLRIACHPAWTTAVPIVARRGASVSRRASHLCSSNIATLSASKSTGRNIKQRGNVVLLSTELHNEALFKDPPLGGPAPGMAFF